ncbi:MAG: hypothetical protein JSV36_12760 [Anaerolineae bacterium]|nr:MAG: hypothetical protein JSV36_12760 [Anaerolineae bacterium]
MYTPPVASPTDARRQVVLALALIVRQSCGIHVAATARGLECAVGDGRLEILAEGGIAKFVARVDQITFSGHERAAFELTPEGVALKEIAPGVDLERHVLSQMGFRPLVPADLKTMDARIFR